MIARSSVHSVSAVATDVLVRIYNRRVATHHEEDVKLAQELLNGKVEAFDAFVDNFRARVYQYSYLMCGQREDAEEVAQETLLKVFDNFASLRDATKVRSWVFRIVKNECLMKRRRSTFAPDRELSLEQYVHADNRDGGEFVRDIPSQSERVEEQVYRREVNAALTRAIQQMSPTHKAVVLLRDIEELSTEEIADVLGITPAAVNQRLHRARLALKSALGSELRSNPNELAERRFRSGVQ